MKPIKITYGNGEKKRISKFTCFDKKGKELSEKKCSKKLEEFGLINKKQSKREIERREN